MNPAIFVIRFPATSYGIFVKVNVLATRDVEQSSLPPIIDKVSFVNVICGREPSG